MSQQMALPQGAPVDLQRGAYIGEEWLITATFPGLSPAGSFVAATASRGAGQPALPTLQGNFDEIWSVETIYSFGAVPTPDIQLIITVNGSNQPFTVLFSSVLQTNFARPGLQYSWSLYQGSTLSFSMSNTAVVGALPVAVTFRLKIGRFKL
jgi:hypothetical protein